MLTIRPINLKTEGPALAKLCWAYRDLLITRTTHVPDMVERYYSQSDYTALIAKLPEIHARPMGDILVADLNDKPVGCAMYYQHPTGSCEIKRIFVDQTARGHGGGEQLIRAAMKRAKADGHRHMVLDTVHTLTEAISLYQRVGFTPSQPFYDPDPAYTDTLRFFDIQL
jgi:GNAT superfamily N-acetyltransferase